MLRIDLNRPEGEEMGVDPRVKVRFGFLVGDWTRLDSREIDRRLREKAQEESPGASLNDLIKKMVKEVAYGQARLSLKEFVERFRKNKLAELIAMKFVNSLFVIDTEQRGEPEWADGRGLSAEGEGEPEQMVLRSVIGFLDRNKLTSTETLYEFLRQQKVDWPMVNIQNLFLTKYEEVGADGQVRLKSLKRRVVSKIEDSLENIAAEAYSEKFNEDKRGFVMGFMMGRVVRYDSQAKKMTFDREEFRALVGYLDSIGCDISNFEGRTLYDWLYYDSRGMAKYVEEQRVNAARFETRHRLEQAGGPLTEEEAKSPLFFEEDFDVKAFHDRYIKPELFRFYSSKLGKMRKVREMDLFHALHDVNNLGRANYTLQLRRYLTALLEVYKKSPKQFFQKVKDLLGLQHSPYLSVLSNQDVQGHFNYFFGQTREKFKKVLAEALYYRKDEAIHRACVYPEEILNCTDLVSLIEWFLRPELFKQQFPHHSGLPNDQIAYMCSSLMREFMNVMERMSDRKFIEAEKRRNLLVEDMRRSLNIRHLGSVELSFQLVEEVDQLGRSFSPQRLDVVLDARDVQEFVNGQDRRLAEQIARGESHNGLLECRSAEGHKQYFRLYGQEKKKFSKVLMTIPVMRYDQPSGEFIKEKDLTTSALIYSGDDQYVHLKDPLTILLSYDRGKEVTDESRWMICFANTEGKEAFKSFLYSRNPKGMIKNEDASENRFVSNKKRSGNAARSTKKFKQGQEFVHTMEMSYVTAKVQRMENGRKVKLLQTEKMTLETQCQTLRNLLTTNLSQNSPSSHDVYKAQSYWPLVFSYYFPPEIFGDQFKEFQDQGFMVENED